MRYRFPPGGPGSDARWGPGRLGRGVAEPVAVEHPLEDGGSAGLAGLDAQRLERGHVVLRDLPDRGVGRRDQRDDPGQPDRTHPGRRTHGARSRRAARRRTARRARPWEDPLPVAVDRPAGEPLHQPPGDLQRLLLGGDPVCGRAAVTDDQTRTRAVVVGDRPGRTPHLSGVGSSGERPGSSAADRIGRQRRKRCRRMLQGACSSACHTRLTRSAAVVSMGRQAQLGINPGRSAAPHPTAAMNQETRQSNYPPRIGGR